MYFFEILYLFVYAHGWSFLILCIGKCVGSLSMYGGGFGCSNDNGGCIVSNIIQALTESGTKSRNTLLEGDTL